MSNTGIEHSGESGPGKVAGAAPATLTDLNEPLTAIDNYVQAGRRLMERGYANEATLEDLFSKLDGQISRCYELLRELRQTEHGMLNRRDKP